jgi:hypothetical protein
MRVGFRYGKPQIFFVTKRVEFEERLAWEPG